MSTKLIQTQDYLLLIDEEAEIKNCYYIDTNNNLIRIGNIDRTISNLCYKIIAYYPLTKEAKELDLPLLPNPFKDEFNNINELAIKHWESRTYEDMDICCDNFIAGYKAAQPKQFSLEDVKKAFEAGCNYASKPYPLNIEFEKEFIQSLSTQQLPKKFIPEYEFGGVKSGYTISHKIGENNILKTKTNSESKQEMVGKYR